MNPNSQVILNKYISLPQNLQQEAADFIDFLISKYQAEKNSSSKPGKRKSNFGSAKGLIVMRSDFDDPIEDFKEYM